MAHAPVDPVGVIPNRKDGTAVVKHAHLLWEEPADRPEQQAANSEGVLPLTALHQGGDLPGLVPLHKHPAKDGEAPQLGVVGVRGHNDAVLGHGAQVRGGGATGGLFPTQRNCPGLVELAEHGLVL